MPCYCPVSAYRTRDGITFQRSRSLSGEKFDLPCGQCIGCRLERSRQWAVRLVHESKFWRRNSFLTLTYDDRHMPVGGTLVKRDFQLFMKRLRKARAEPLRFYACGEYGPTTLRPHYHAILFNCSFPDGILHSRNDRDQCYYRSDELNGLWDKGHCLISDVTFDSAAYVARYCVKKVTGDRADSHYAGREPEFALMSRRPGIGSDYYRRYGQEVRDHDSVVIDGREVSPPRFYDARTEACEPVAFERNRRARKMKAVKAWRDNVVDRRRVKEVIALRKLALKQRSI